MIFWLKIFYVKKLGIFLSKIFIVYKYCLKILLEKIFYLATKNYCLL